MTEQAKCELCGEPMPENEQMFRYHGYSGPCPKSPLPRPMTPTKETMEMAREWLAHTICSFHRDEDCLAALLTQAIAQAKLDEARWWKPDDHDKVCVGGCLWCARIAALTKECEGTNDRAK
jgi:hypothetical protein